MPDLFQTLRTTDLDFVQRLARSWKLELSARDFASTRDEFIHLVKDRELFTEVIETLPERATAGWQYLATHKGQESWSIFIRQFGELRTFGAAKRVREEPDLHPTSATEDLWYRGLIGRAFLGRPPATQEYAYIPDEFLAFLDLKIDQANRIDLRPAAALEKKLVFPASERILDDVTDLLAALRMGRPTESIFAQHSEAYQRFVNSLLLENGLLSNPLSPDAGKVKDFLARPRGEALYELFKAWVTSSRINDLRMLPGLLFEGNWSNDPLTPRTLIVETLRSTDPKTWWSVSAFLNQVREKQPDFQRPAGDYDSWFIRDAVTNEHLHGAEHWEEVDGKLLYTLLSGPLHWLGLTDLARSDKGSLVTAFKLSALGVDLIENRAPSKCKAEDGILTVSSDGILHVPVNTPRAIRYQVARFSMLQSGESGERKYRITPASLKAAADQGLKVSHLLQLFQQAKVKDLPPNLVQQMERWEKYGAEASVEQVILLRLARPELLPLLQKNSRASGCIASVLNNQAILLKPGKMEQMRQSLAELGLLAEIKLDSDV
jgi:hypothetical protein